MVDWFVCCRKNLFHLSLTSASQFSQRKGRKKGGNSKKKNSRKSCRAFADSYPHCNEQRREGTPGAASFLESRGEDEGGGQGQAHCAKHIGHSSMRDGTEGWWQAPFAYLGLYTWRALKVFVHVLPGTWKKLALVSKHNCMEQGCPIVTCSTQIASESPKQLTKILAKDAKKRKFKE